MNNDERGGLIGVFIFFVLPMILGLILVIKARSLARASIHVLVQSEREQREPSALAILRYRVIGTLFIVAPIVLFLTDLLLSSTPH